uniref:C2H2-type domain-containing protein n=1 Tax=Oreochromis niloticus TaxID=8128 RepID=I3KYY2_ORENI
MCYSAALESSGFPCGVLIYLFLGNIFLPLSSLRLLIPPMRLISAAMWQVAQRRDVLDYEKLDEFVTLVTASVPDLLNPKQRGKLLLRLRARVILELCRNEETANILDEDLSCNDFFQSGDAEVDAEEAIFVELTQTLLKDPAEREHFYQEVFPTEYGLSYDADMQLLVWELLSKLERLLPVPDLGQTVSWLTSAPSVLKDCLQVLSNPNDLKSLLQHHKCLEHLSTQGKSVSHFKRPFLCSHCGKRFTQMGLLKLHSERTACGQTCNPQLDLTTEVVVTEVVSEKGGAQYKCQKCGESFSSILDRLRHRQRHIVRRQYKCSMCEKLYGRASDLKRHHMKHTGERPFPCECGKSFTHVWLLNKHQQTHSKERPYPCAECGKSFTQLQILNRHLLTHNGQRPFQCSYCEKSFTQLASLTRHERIHTGERPYLCTTCQKSFLTHGELVRHQRSHSNFRPFSCPQCPKSFKTKRAHSEHFHSHTGEHPFECGRCGKRFSKSTSLVRHNLTHTGERPHSCSQCGKTFLTSGELLLHKRTHTGERPYPCSYCERRFRCSSDLNIHVRTHTGEKPHSCAFCKKGFSTSTRLKRHMRTHSEKVDLLSL